MLPIKSLLLLICGIALNIPAQAIPDNPFNQFVYDFQENSLDHFSKPLCAQPVWQELAEAARESNIVQSEDFVQALHDLYCVVTPPDELLIRRFKGMTYVDNAEKTHRLQTLTILRKYFAHHLLNAPSAIWISVKNEGKAVALGIDREGGGDDLEMRFINRRWMFIRVRDGGGC